MISVSKSFHALYYALESIKFNKINSCRLSFTFSGCFFSFFYFNIVVVVVVFVVFVVVVVVVTVAIVVVFVCCFSKVIYDL